LGLVELAALILIIRMFLSHWNFFFLLFTYEDLLDGNHLTKGSRAFKRNFMWTLLNHHIERELVLLFIHL